jgi:hypothetical protein
VREEKVEVVGDFMDDASRILAAEALRLGRGAMGLWGEPCSAMVGG